MIQDASDNSNLENMKEKDIISIITKDKEEEIKSLIKNNENKDVMDNITSDLLNVSINDDLTQPKWEQVQYDKTEPQLFSSEISQHSIIIAQRRARKLEMELREEYKLEKAIQEAERLKKKKSLISVLENIFSKIINQPGSSLKNKKRPKPTKKNVFSRKNNYLLVEAQPRDQNDEDFDDFDMDGDGIQLSPQRPSKKNVDKSDCSENTHLKNSEPIRPVLKMVSAYSLDKESQSNDNFKENIVRYKKEIRWKNDVCDNIDEDLESHDEKSDHINNNNKRKKRSIIRRLTPNEKEELYKLRPDLRIIPNWAQKYRQEITNEHDTRSFIRANMLLVSLIVCLVIFILIAVILFKYRS